MGVLTWGLFYKLKRVGRAVAAAAFSNGRGKSEQGKGTVVANGHSERSAGKCNRKYTADGYYLCSDTGKGEKVW